MSRSGPSGPAEGAGPGRRGPSGASRRAVDVGPANRRNGGRGGQPGRRSTPGAPRAPWRSGDRPGRRERTAEGAASGPATPSGGEPLTGEGESPWVRFEQAEPGAGASPPPLPPPLPDLSALLLALEGLRSAVPRELSDQLTALVRELLLTLRALIDWYLERLDGGPVEKEVEDIPID